ncbi:hypothetical protein D3C75_896010 [compost metagenome]
MEHQQSQRRAHAGQQQRPVEIEGAVVDAQGRVEAKRQALQQEAEGRAKHQGRQQGPHHQGPVPPAAPQGIRQLAAIVKAHRAQEEAEQQEHEGHIERREGGGIDQGPGGEQGAGTGDEPHLVALPHWAHAVEQHAPLLIGVGHHGEQHADPEIEAVHHHEADEQEEHQPPPDEFQGFVIHQTGLPFFNTSP